MRCQSREPGGLAWESGILEKVVPDQEVRVRLDEPEEETRLQAIDAIRLYGRYASSVVTRQAEALFLQGDLIGAFHHRLVAMAIAEIEATNHGS